MTDRSRERAREDYIKAIYQLGKVGPVRSADVARRLEISRSSVSQFRHILEREGFVHPSTDRLDLLRLTSRGIDVAIKMVRRHRVIETFLHASLDFPLERVHAEAERIEHVLSDDIVMRLARMLGTPECDPHGHRIPYEAVPEPSESSLRLSDIAVGTHVVVASMDDRESEIVRFLYEARIVPGLEAVIRESGPRVVLERLDETRASIVVPLEAARAVRCASAAAPA